MKICGGSIPWKKVIFSLTLFSIGYFADDVMTGVAMWRGRELLQNPDTHPVLPDIGFDLVPMWELCKNKQAATYTLLTFMILTLFRMMIFFDEGWEVFCRFAVVDGFLMLLRSTTIAITSLNNPWPDCNQCGIDTGCPDTLYESVVYTILRFPLYDCGDLIFSGHTVHYIMCALVWHSYDKTIYHKIQRAIVWIFTLFGITMLLSCRFHYSVDILLATYLSFSAWFYWDYVQFVHHPITSGIVRFLSKEKGGETEAKL
eukprot:TRINITY_DN10612_c0_g1_i1.p1 TRINITY_DN10612_c0_g1~~TRINITY_DN10612_c0_g1_i1.p1  ORF type:complete len:258 (-),score=35.53 TRINITY_DN10612_c0_g1_i1:46-819(-)